MKRGWKQGTKKWFTRKDLAGAIHRLVDDLTVESKNKAHAVSFKVSAVLILPFKSQDTGCDAQIAEEYAIKFLGKDKAFFKTVTLHHDFDGTLMYVDRTLHQSKRHVGFRFNKLQKIRKELGLI